jgi:hypothetical protein
LAKTLKTDLRRANVNAMSRKRDTGLHDQDRLAIPLDPEEALRALLKVDPESEPVERNDQPPKQPGKRRPDES